MSKETMSILGNFLLDGAIFLLSSILVLLLYFQYAYSYWARKKVPFLKPKFPMGNMDTILPKGISFGIISKKFYQEFKKQGHKYGGVYSVAYPHLVVVDPEYVKLVLTRDFQYFSDRGIYRNEKAEPIMVNIFSQDGKPWRHIRTKMTPSFTGSKVKMMYQFMANSVIGMEEKLKMLAEKDEDIDMLEIAGRYTADIIGTAIFGLEINSLKDEESEFRIMGRRIFTEFNLWFQLNLFAVVNTPSLARFLGVRSMQKDVADFFERLLTETVRYRKENNIKMADFLQMLIDLMDKGEITMGELVAQAFLFFQAGSETSSKTILFTILELAKDQHAQDLARDEVHKVLKKYNDELSYDSLNEMKYLQQCVDEASRLWPALATIPRVCTKDCELGDSGLVVEKGTGIMIPALALHTDPDYFPDPMKFDPERFNEENKSRIVPGTYMPFGDGPRLCLGMRFGLVQSKLGIAAVLKNFKVTLSSKTKLPIELNPDTFVSATTETILFKLEKL